MKLASIALLAVTTVGAPAWATSTDGQTGYVVARADDGSFVAECHFARGKGVTFGGSQTGVAGMTSITCTVSAGGTTLAAYGTNVASGSGQLPAGPVQVCVDASVVRFVDSSHARGCQTW
jgi:hypothetical protein